MAFAPTTNRAMRQVAAFAVLLLLAQPLAAAAGCWLQSMGDPGCAGVCETPGEMNRMDRSSRVATPAPSEGCCEITANDTVRRVTKVKTLAKQRLAPLAEPAPADTVPCEGSAPHAARDLALSLPSIDLQTQYCAYLN